MKIKRQKRLFCFRFSIFPQTNLAIGQRIRTDGGGENSSCQWCLGFDVIDFLHILSNQTQNSMVCCCNTSLQKHVRIQRGGGQGVRTPPLKNHKNIGFLSNNGPDPCKATTLPCQNLMFGHHRPASETPFKWRFADGQMMARL